jgi:hypothetical protein
MNLSERRTQKPTTKQKTSSHGSHAIASKIRVAKDADGLGRRTTIRSWVFCIIPAVWAKETVYPVNLSLSVKVLGRYHER